MPSFPKPHYEVISAGESYIGRGSAFSISYLFCIVVDFIKVFHLDHVITCGLPVPVGFKVSHTLFLILLGKVGDI